MNRKEFLNKIDCNLNYDIEEIKKLLIQAKEIWPDMVYSLLEEVLRTPYNKLNEIWENNVKKIQLWFVKEISNSLPPEFKKIVINYINNRMVNCFFLEKVFRKLCWSKYKRYRSLFNILLDIWMDCTEIEEMYDNCFD